MSSKNTLPPSTNKHGTAKQWLQRHLRKQPSHLQLSGQDEGELRRRITINRPQTAPSGSAPPSPTHAPVAPPILINIERVTPQSFDLPLPRSARPSSGVIRNVDAWLDTTSTSAESPPLMGGLTYWRTATGPIVKNTANTQHAIPIKRERNLARPSTSHSHQAKSVHRRPRRIQVQMPSLSRGKSQRTITRKQINRRSHSVPVLGIPYESMSEGEPPAMMVRAQFLSTAHSDRPTLDEPAREHLRYHHHTQPSAPIPIRYASPVGPDLLEAEGSIGRRMGVFFGRSSRSADSTRPSTATTNLVAREDSLGDLSDAPTYFSGLPPPSYRSRGTSILTTSSFGCIDGMNPEHRYLSQQRAAEQRSMKGRLKRLAQTLTAQ